jgi:hypothetical protein
MERCRQCNSTLAKEEKICWSCNAAIPEKNPKRSMASRFQTLINVLFIVFCVLTVLSLFLPAGYVPSFNRCLAGLVVMFLVRSSSRTMAEAKKS